MIEALHKSHTLTLPVWCCRACLPHALSLHLSALRVSDCLPLLFMSVIGCEVCLSASAKWDLLISSKRLQAKLLRAMPILNTYEAVDHLLPHVSSTPSRRCLATHSMLADDSNPLFQVCIVTTFCIFVDDAETSAMQSQVLPLLNAPRRVLM